MNIHLISSCAGLPTLLQTPPPLASAEPTGQHPNLQLPRSFTPQDTKISAARPIETSSPTSATFSTTSGRVTFSFHTSIKDSAFFRWVATTRGASAREGARVGARLTGPWVAGSLVTNQTPSDSFHIISPSSPQRGEKKMVDQKLPAQDLVHDATVQLLFQVQSPQMSSSWASFPKNLEVASLALKPKTHRRPASAPLNLIWMICERTQFTLIRRGACTSRSLLCYSPAH